MMKRFFVAVALLGAVFMVTPAPARAAAPIPTCQPGVATFLSFRSWDACLNHINGVPQLTSIYSIWAIVLVVLEDALKAAGYVAAGFVIWGGIKYLKSQGDPGQINEARLVIYNALFGLLLALISVAIVNFVAGAIQ